MRRKRIALIRTRMLDAIQHYAYERRQGVIKSALVLYGSYAVGSYVGSRLDEMKDKMVRTKLARETLRRRFQSTHDDVCFTIMALIPTLASQILEEMDVEALTNELQSMSRAARSRNLPPPNPLMSQSLSELGSVSDVNSDAGSVSISSYSGSVFEGDRTSGISGSWVEASESARPEMPAQLSDSVTSTASSLSQNGRNLDASTTSMNSRSRAQLWNEVKILALTRTLTTMYTITLLSLLTAVQLNLLGRSRYIDSVKAADQAERERDRLPHFSLTGILARETISHLVDVEAIWPAWIFGEAEEGDENDGELDAISEATELRFLTLSWWVLHVGWKDVAARVRGSVESVFKDVSLKAKLSPSELYTFIMDVRRRVEMDDTGSKLGTRFLQSLLPPTPETAAHVLAQGGALRMTQESETSSSPDLFRMTSPRPQSDSNRSPARRGEVELLMPSLEHEGSGRTTIPIESPRPHRGVFPTPPSSQSHESDLGSRASQSPENPLVSRLQPAQSLPVTDSLATSHSALDIDPQFAALLEETRRYLSGPDFTHALGCALDRATEVLMDGLRTRVFVDTATAVNTDETQTRSSTGGVDEGGLGREEVKIRLAGLLPGLARWCQLALNATPNELVDNVMAVREVNALEAIVISDYEGRFPPVS